MDIQLAVVIVSGVIGTSGVIIAALLTRPSRQKETDTQTITTSSSSNPHRPSGQIPKDCPEHSGLVEKIKNVHADTQEIKGAVKTLVENQTTMMKDVAEITGQFRKLNGG